MALDPLDPDWPRLPPLSGLTAIETTPSEIRATTEAGPLTVAAYAPGILRLTLGTPSGPDYGMLVAEPAPPPIDVELGPAGPRLTSGDLTLTIAADPLRFDLTRAGRDLLGSTTDGHFRRTHRLPPFARTADGWFAALALRSGERIYGLGEKWGPLDRRGQLLRSRVEDALGVNGEVSYKNCPFAWSPGGWGVWIHTPGQVTHGVGHAAWSQRSYALLVEDHALDLFLIAADRPAAILERYTWLTGRPPRPPRWSLGVWFSKAYYRDAEELLATARQLRAHDIPAEVITVDGRAWQDTHLRFAFQFDPARYPDPRAVIEQLHALGFRLCVWEYPLVSVHAPLFAELEAKGYLLKDRSGRAYRYQWDPAPFGEVLTPLPESGLVDFTNPDAFADWRDRHAALFDLGVDVIKSDFGEQVPDDAVAANGDTGRRLHNVYPLLYNRAVFEATAAAKGTGFVLARAGWSGSQRYPGHWGGDPQTDWEGLAGSIRGALAWGLSGGACYASDIGGYYGAQPDAELFVRWTQAAVFCSHLRFHGIGPREPWVFGPEIEAIVRDWLRLRMRLVPYIEAALVEAERSGLPPMRAMALAFPDQPEAWAFDTQYLFGPDLLVAPILAPGGRVRVFLPDLSRGDRRIAPGSPGHWLDLATGEGFDGGRSVELTYPLERFPVFRRAGAPNPLDP